MYTNADLKIYLYLPILNPKNFRVSYAQSLRNVCLQKHKNNRIR